MAYSVQQIKFELISYIKEFGGDFTQWTVGTADDAPEALFQTYEIDPVNDAWLWKPALTPAAARLVTSWLVERHKAQQAANNEGTCVFMFKKSEDAITRSVNEG